MPTDREQVEALIVRLMEAETPFAPHLGPNGWDTAPDDDLHPAAWRTLDVLLRERDAAEALAYERAADVVEQNGHSLHVEIRALTPSPNALEEHDAQVRAEERERVIAIIEGYQNMKQDLLAIREQAND